MTPAASREGLGAYAGFAALLVICAVALIVAVLSMTQAPPRRVTPDRGRCADTAALVHSLRDSLAVAQERESLLVVANARLIHRYWATWKDSTR